MRVTGSLPARWLPEGKALASRSLWVWFGSRVGRGCPGLPGAGKLVALLAIRADGATASLEKEALPGERPARCSGRKNLGARGESAAPAGNCSQAAARARSLAR